MFRGLLMSWRGVFKRSNSGAGRPEIFEAVWWDNERYARIIGKNLVISSNTIENNDFGAFSVSGTSAIMQTQNQAFPFIVVKHESKGTDACSK